MTEKIIRRGLFVLCLLPFAYLLYAAGAGALGPDPAEQIMHVTGESALRALLLTLLMSPLRQWTGWSIPLRLRRMFGLYAFFYACVHLMSFLHFFVGWTPAILAEELSERPYIMVGFTAWLLMLPLAVTSTRKMQRRLRRNWQRLHSLVYPVALLACLHLLWLSRSDIGEALVYSALVGGLLLWRIRPLFARVLSTTQKV
jgi:sulfoxide reductase heme-binding subunit YedZ